MDEETPLSLDSLLAATGASKESGKWQSRKDVTLDDLIALMSASAGSDPVSAAKPARTLARESEPEPRPALAPVLDSAPAPASEPELEKGPELEQESGPVAEPEPEPEPEPKPKPYRSRYADMPSYSPARTVGFAVEADPKGDDFPSPQQSVPQPMEPAAEFKPEFEWELEEPVLEPAPEPAPKTEPEPKAASTSPAHARSAYASSAVSTAAPEEDYLALDTSQEEISEFNSIPWTEQGMWGHVKESAYHPPQEKSAGLFQSIKRRMGR